MRNGEIDIGFERMGAVEGGGTFVSLHAVLFFGGNVVCVGVGWATENNNRVGDVQFGSCCSRDGGSPSSTGHRSSFTRRDDDDQRTNAKKLNVDNVRCPCVRLTSVPDIEKNRLRVLTLLLVFRGLMDECSCKLPERVLQSWRVGVVGSTLGEVESAWTVRRTTCEAVPKCCSTRADSF